MQERFKIYNCEATLHAYTTSGLIDAVDVVPRDALHVYHALKDMCRRDGHTYVTFSDLIRYFRDKNFTVRDSTAAREFLIENNITVEDESKSRIYLRKYWTAEQNIAESIMILQDLHKVSPWTLDIDFDWYGFKCTVSTIFYIVLQ